MALRLLGFVAAALQGVALAQGMAALITRTLVESVTSGARDKRVGRQPRHEIRGLGSNLVDRSKSQQKTKLFLTRINVFKTDLVLPVGSRLRRGTPDTWVAAL